MAAAIGIQFAGGGQHPGRPALRRWIRAALGERATGTLTLRVVDEPESAELNRRYRGRDYPTNVLSFAAADDWPAFDGEPAPLGDLVVCAPVVAREAAEQGKSLDAHWAHIVTHGVLHLLGYDHETPAAAAVMEAEERRLLAGFGFADPYGDEA